MKNNEMILNALNFIIESRDDANIRIDEILDLDNDPGTFHDFAQDFDFDLESFDQARKLYIRIKG